ncbi:MAG: FGGY family carbohydrate kinase [Sphaerochaetaceae bacterium]|nr:FGGY family carbohydrate kinase [Sphaerochaetaceae bacterium]
MDDTESAGERTNHGSSERMRDTILVYDIGTTSVKTALYDFTGELLSSVQVPYKTRYFNNGWAQQDPEDYWKAAVEGTSQLLNSVGSTACQIHVISLCGHMNGALCIDENGKATYPQIIHCDTRAKSESAMIKEQFGQDMLYRRSGNRIDEYLSLPKILWIARNESESYRKTRHIINAKDYLRGKLTGIFGSTDFSDASLTGALDIHEKRWNIPLLQELGLEESHFGPILTSTEIEGTLSSESARILNLPSGIPVAAGGGDASCSTRGAMITDDHSGYACIGSSAWISLLQGAPVDDPHMRMQHFFDLDGEHVNVCGTVQSAGSALDWAKERFISDRSFEQIEEELQRREPRRPLIALPYFMGERTPHWNADARSALIGMSLTTDSLDLMGAYYESVAFALEEVMEIYEDLNLPVDTFTLLGGGAKSRYWSQMISDVLNRTITIHPFYQHATSYGASLAGAVAVGQYKSLDEAIMADRSNPSVITADAQRHERYQKNITLYKKAYRALEPLFSQLET